MSKHRRPTHGSRRTGLAAAALGVAVLTTLGASAPAMAAKGGGGGKPSGGSSSAAPSLVLVDAQDGVANRGDRVTFTVPATGTDRPFVGVKCWQGTTGVYNNSIGIFPEYLFDPWLTMDSMYWTTGQDATCTATLYYYDRRGNQNVLGATSYTVVG